jgi:hypothetical protein
MSLRGSLDVVTTTGAMGWAYSSVSKEKLLVHAMLNQAVIGEAIAELHRADLAAVGFGDGNCGYSIVFYHQIDPLYLPFVVVKPDGGDVTLPRSTISGCDEFFRALYAQYPVTGRHRSVFGGLWSDRIDAAALLRGRVEIGMVARDEAAILSTFLQTGFSVLEDVFLHGAQADSPFGINRSGNSTKESTRSALPSLTELVSAVLRLEPVLKLLHPILEGPPLALGARIAEGADESFRQPSSIEALPSPAECLGLIVPLNDAPVELDVVRDSHLFPEFTAEGQSRWISRSAADATEVALRQHGMIDRYAVQPGSVVVIGPGLIHRVRTEPDTVALRMVCTPSRHAPLNRMLDGSYTETVLENGARLWT